MESEAKLYGITSKNCQFPLHAGGPDDVVSNYTAHDIPQLFWPDGTICWPANLYLNYGFSRGLSRKNKGGTLLTWAKHLSHLIRWCHKNKIDFVDLTDSHFALFIRFLLSERQTSAPELAKRNDKHVASIGSTALNFLDYLDKRTPGLNLLGPTGKIKAEKKIVQYRGPRGELRGRSVWVHYAIPRHRGSRRREPISSAAVNRLYEANCGMAATPFVRRRRFIMLRLFDATGGRRIEIASIKVQDLKDALNSGELKVFTAKRRRDDVSRLVPIAKSDLKEILSFVEHYRKLIIRRTIGVGKDHGYLFIAESTGRPLESDTLGSEMYLLRKEAGIEDEEVCLQSFRHRYITNIFRNLIRTHQYENVSDLKRALLSTEELKLKVMEWTGHKSIESLDHYIHLAFEAESNFGHTLNILQAINVVGSLRTLLKEYNDRIQCGQFSEMSFENLGEIVDGAAIELDELLRQEELLETAIEE